MLQRFPDRTEAGRRLAGKLADYAGRDDVVVLGLARGGVPVAYEVARALGAPLDVLMVRKLNVPGLKEMAMGAVAEGGVCFLNEGVVRDMRIPADQIEAVVAHERAELERLSRLYRDSRPEPEVKGRTVIVVDDGVATGSTVKAAVEALRRRGPARILVAVPVAPRVVCEDFGREVGTTCVCTLSPDPFGNVGRWYRDFTPTTDAEVCALLVRASREQVSHAA